MKLIHVTPHPKLPPYLVALQWRFNKSLGDTLKAIPSVRYAPELGRGTWIGAVDALPAIAAEAAALGYQLAGGPDEPSYTAPPPSSLAARLHSYQRTAAYAAAHHGARMLAFDPGLGKTAAALAALQSVGVRRALVICPAIARRVWQEQAERWGYCRPEAVHIVDGSKTAAIPEGAALVAVSYELAAKITWTPDAVILDESHYCKNASAQRSKAVRSLIDKASPKLLLALTGTPIMNQPADLHAQLDLLHPGRWGSQWQFVKRYANAIEEPYAQSGWRYEGLRADTAEELRVRLAAVCDRVTVDAVAHLLPPLTVSPLWIDVAAPMARRALTEATARKAQAHRAHEAAAATAALKAHDGRLDHAARWAVEAAACGPAVVFVYRRGSASELVRRLTASGVRAVAVTGADVHEARHAAVARWQADPQGVFVATIDSMGVAIDLTHARQVLVAELHFQPGAVIQALRRCYRLSSKAAVAITILAIRGTYDDRIVRVLEEKLRNIEALQDTSEIDRATAAALRDDGETEEAWTARLRSQGAALEWDPYR